MDILATIFLTLLGIPVLFFTIECLLGCIPMRKKHLPSTIEEIRTAILVPAHNEEEVIANTLENLKEHIEPTDIVIVVADNCSDKTASIVKEYGFVALERESETERGKGYALDFGMQYLREQAQTPDIVVIVDADCLLEAHALAWLKASVIERDRPVQACYLMKSGTVTRIGVKVSEFAFKVKNKIRLRGLSRLGMPVPLTGTGMAFPWKALASAKLATGDIVEDMRLGVELAENGMGATYCDEAQVHSFFPTSEAAEKTQRERWEHGHLSTLRAFVPRLFKRAIAGPSAEALGMMLDLLIPPLSLLVMIIGSVFVGFIAYAWLFDTWLYVTIAGNYLALLMVVIGITWFLHGRDILSAKQMLHIPIYIVSKIVVYVGYIVRKQTKWIRTDRH